METNFSLRSVFSAIMGIVVLSWGMIIVWASNRGLDLTDEGMYLLQYSMPANGTTSVSSFHLVQRFLFPFVDCTIQHLRIERLVLSVFSSVLLAGCSLYYIRNNSLQSAKYSIHDSITLYTLILSGTFLSYAFGPQTPAYNTLSAFFIVVAFSLFLVDLSKVQSKLMTSFIYLAAGIICGILFLVKFPNALLLPFVFIFFYFVFNLSSQHGKRNLIAQTLFRFVLLILGYFIFHLAFWKDANQVFQFHRDFFSFVSQISGYDGNSLSRIYVNSLIGIFNSLCTVKFLLILFSLAGIAFCVLKKYYKLFFLFLIVQVVVIARFKLFYGGEVNKTEQSIIYFLWSFTFLVIVIIQAVIDKTIVSIHFKKILLLALLLMTMPVFGAIGTNNVLQVQVIFYIPFWMLLIYLIGERVLNPVIIRVICLCIILLAFSQSVDAIIRHPYRINGNLVELKEKLVVGKGESILVDQRYKQNIFAIDSVLKKCGFQKGDYIFTYTDVVGLAYVFNSPLPAEGNSWFNPGNDMANCKSLQRFSHSSGMVQLFFILDGRFPFSGSFKNCLAQLGYDFDNRYYKAGEVAVDFSNDPHTLLIYVPLRLVDH